MSLLDELNPPCPRGCGRSMDDCHESEDGGECEGGELFRENERLRAECDRYKRRIEQALDTSLELRRELKRTAQDRDIFASANSATGEVERLRADLATYQLACGQHQAAAGVAKTEAGRLKAQLKERKADYERAMKEFAAAAEAEIARLKVQLSNYAHDRDEARQERDKAERELKQQYDDFTKAGDDAARSMNEKLAEAKRAIADLHRQHGALTEVKIWTNEDGKRFCFVDDIADALGWTWLKDSTAPSSSGTAADTETPLLDLEREEAGSAKLDRQLAEVQARVAADRAVLEAAEEWRGFFPEISPAALDGYYPQERKLIAAVDDRREQIAKSTVNAAESTPDVLMTETLGHSTADGPEQTDGRHSPAGTYRRVHEKHAAELQQRAVEYEALGYTLLASAYRKASEAALTEASSVPAQAEAGQ